MLSSIQLTGGDVYLQDIAGLTAAPELLVLSTCDSAAAAVRAGDEVIGIGAALLGLGTNRVVATSNVLPDVARPWNSSPASTTHRQRPAALHGPRGPELHRRGRRQPSRSPQPSRASARAEARPIEHHRAVRSPVSRSPAPASIGERPVRARPRTLRQCGPDGITGVAHGGLRDTEPVAERVEVPGVDRSPLDVMQRTVPDAG